MWSLLLSFITGPLVTIGLKVADLAMARMQAKTDIEKAVIDQQIQQLNATRDVILASQKNPVTAYIYWGLLAVAALGPIAWIFKRFLIDGVIGPFYGCVGRTVGSACDSFTTDAIDSNSWWIITVVFGFLFLASRKR